VLNSICYYHPQILKNEIEYLHSKLSQKQKQQAEEGNHMDSRYEREFAVRGGKRFKLIVDQGQVFLQCIDRFEDIFEVSREIVGRDIELTDLLEPGMFDSHKEVVNALFEVYHELGTQYCQKMYFASANKVKEEAEGKVRERYGINKTTEDSMIEEETKELMRSLKQ
jgi:hypothetical protein